MTTRSSSQTEDGRFETQDLTLAGVLHLHGFDTPTMRRVGAKRGAWVYERDAYLDELVRDYNAGTVNVEPRKLMNAVGKVRSDLYRYLGHNPGRVSDN